MKKIWFKHFISYVKQIHIKIKAPNVDNIAFLIQRNCFNLDKKELDEDPDVKEAKEEDDLANMEKKLCEHQVPVWSRD